MMIILIILVSIILAIIISFFIAYLWVKLLSKILPSPIFYPCDKSSNNTRTQREYSNKTINMIVFLHCISEILHTNIPFWNPIRIRKTKTKFHTSGNNKINDGDNKNDDTYPETFLHDGTSINDIATKSKQNLRISSKSAFPLERRKARLK